jgi:hypothetical protein
MPAGVSVSVTQFRPITQSHQSRPITVSAAEPSSSNSMGYYQAINSFRRPRRLMGNACRDERNGITGPTTAFRLRLRSSSPTRCVRRCHVHSAGRHWIVVLPKRFRAARRTSAEVPSPSGWGFCRSKFALPSPPLAPFICAQTGFCRSKFTLPGDNQLSRPSIAVKNGPP